MSKRPATDLKPTVSIAQGRCDKPRHTCKSSLSVGVAGATNPAKDSTRAPESPAVQPHAGRTAGTIETQAFRLYAPEECTGKNGYPEAWHETLKHEVREQAGHRCIRCLHPYRKGAGKWSPCDERCEHTNDNVRWLNRLGVWTTVPLNLDEDAVREAEWRILTVHHLDGNKGNCRWWNLVALCQRCHLQIQGKVKMERRWPHEHSDWFKPYVAGYYAHAYLGEDIDRAEAEERMDELLALEVRQLEMEAA